MKAWRRLGSCGQGGKGWEGSGWRACNRQGAEQKGDVALQSTSARVQDRAGRALRCLRSACSSSLPLFFSSRFIHVHSTRSRINERRAAASPPAGAIAGEASFMSYTRPPPLERGLSRRDLVQVRLHVGHEFQMPHTMQLIWVRQGMSCALAGVVEFWCCPSTDNTGKRDATEPIPAPLAPGLV